MMRSDMTLIGVSQRTRLNCQLIYGLRFWKMNYMCLLLCVSVDVEHILSESESDET